MSEHAPVRGVFIASIAAMETARKLGLVALVLATGIGCGPYRASTDPDAMSETAHRERASSLYRSAEQHRGSYSSAQIRRAETTHGGYGGILGGANPGATHATPPGRVVDPGAGHLSAARRLRALGQEHEAAADELVSFEADECVDIEPDVRPRCPLLGSVRSVAEVEDGVAIELSPEADRELLVRHARCHAAFGRRLGRDGMSSCPLYVEGVRVELSDGQIWLTTDVASEVEDLRNRAQTHLGTEQ